MKIDRDKFHEAFTKLNEGEAPAPDGDPAPEPDEPSEQAEPDEPEVEQEDPPQPEGDLEVEEPEQVDDPEAEGDDDQPEDDSDEPSRLVIDEGAVIVLPDGTEIPADEAVLRQQDYTRKTQSLADERRKFESEREEFEGQRQELLSWVTEREQNPSQFIAEIAQTGDPTYLIAKAIRDMNDAGLLDPEFVKVVGLEPGQPAAKVVDDGDTRTRIERLEQEREEERRRQELQQAAQARLAELEAEWARITSDVPFQSRADELDLQAKVAEFAQQAGVTDLSVAYDAYVRRHPEALPKKAPPKKAPPKKTTAISRSTSSPGSKPDPVPPPSSTRESARQAWQKVMGTKPPV